MIDEIAVLNHTEREVIVLRLFGIQVKSLLQVVDLAHIGAATESRELDMDFGDCHH